MKFSVITAVYNSASTIQSCFQSISSQTYNDIEHIVIDGCSSDGTVELIKDLTFKTQNYKLVSEPDSGIYDALNKGIKLADGEVICLLHADDVFAHNDVLKNAAKLFIDLDVDSVYGDLEYVSRNNISKIIRSWKAGSYNKDKILNGWMPPHPTFFVKKTIYDKYGAFDTSFKISSDYDIVLRFLYKHKISTAYLPEVLIKMRTGGASNKSIKNIITKSSEDYKALKKNGIPNPLQTLFRKNFSKIPQFFNN